MNEVASSSNRRGGSTTSTATTASMNNASSNLFPFSDVTMKRLPTSWPHYALDWSQNSSNFCTLAIGSFLPSRHNYIQVLTLPDIRDDKFIPVTETPLPIDYVATKVLWSPSKIKNSEYLAASGDGVYIWKATSPDDSSGSADATSFTLTGRLISKHGQRRASEDSSSLLSRSASSLEATNETNPPAPVTSFDWNRIDPTRLVTTSYDTTCTIWCLETGAIKTQLIAHDKEVFDVAFSPVSTETFVSVGADGSLRLFDVRNLDHSTIVYESPEARPLLRLAWNALDPNYLATFAVDSNRVIVMDIRMPSVPAAELVEHDGAVVSIRWSPSSSSHLMTADEQALRLWDLAEYDKDPSAKYLLKSSNSLFSNNQMTDGADPSPIQSLLWPAISPDWIGVASIDQVSIMRL